jgi:hypothetical protein
MQRGITGMTPTKGIPACQCQPPNCAPPAERFRGDVSKEDLHRDTPAPHLPAPAPHPAPHLRNVPEGGNVSAGAHDTYYLAWIPPTCQRQPPEASHPLLQLRHLPKQQRAVRVMRRPELLAQLQQGSGALVPHLRTHVCPLLSKSCAVTADAQECTQKPGTPCSRLPLPLPSAIFGTSHARDCERHLPGWVQNPHNK